MNKVFLGLLLSVVSISGLSCSTAADSNEPVSNANLQSAATPAASPAETVAPAEEPVAVFTDARSALEAGNKYFDAGAIDKSIEAYQQAVKLDSNLADAHFQLGVSLALVEDESVEETPAETPARKSKKGAKEAVKLTPSQKAFTDAAAAYEKIVKKNDEDHAAFFNLGRSYNKLNEDEKAEKALRQAVKLQPEDVSYQVELGKILIKLADYDEAVKALKKAVSLDETNLQASDLLEKAQAGDKRTSFGIKPKPLEDPAAKNSKAAPRGAAPSKPRSTPLSRDVEPPPPVNKP